MSPSKALYNVVIDILDLKSVTFFIFYLLFLFFVSAFHFPGFFFLLSCGSLEHFLEFHFDLFLEVWVYLFIIFCIVLLGITLYIRNLSQSTCGFKLEWSIKTLLSFSSLKFPLYNIIVLIFLLCISRATLHSVIIFASTVKHKTQGESNVLAHIFAYCVLCSFLCSKVPVFIISFLFRELPVCSLLE